MKNILIFIDSLDSGGAQKQALLLSKCLDISQNVFLTIYYSERIDAQFLNDLTGLKNKPLLLKGGHFKKNLTFYNFIKKNKIDIMFTYLLLPNFIGGILGKLAGVKKIIGGIRSSQLAKKKIVTEKLIHNYVSDYTVYNNFKGRDNLVKQGFKESKTHIIPNVYEVATKLILRTNHKKIKILSVGRFIAAKDYLTAIKAIYLLKKESVDFHYTIIGWGELQNQLLTWINEYQLNENVTIVVKPKNINEYYIESDIFLLTSVFEGLSNAIMEAMGFSLPVVATNVGDNNRLVLENETGFLVEVGNSSQIAERLALLAHDSGLRLEMGIKSFNYISENYSKEIFEKRYLQLIENDFKA